VNKFGKGKLESERCLEGKCPRTELTSHLLANKC
jgi:hypothetical protein